MSKSKVNHNSKGYDLQNVAQERAQKMVAGRIDTQAAHTQAKLKENVHSCLSDNVKHVITGYPCTALRPPERLRPEAMPAAGAQVPRDMHDAPFGHHTLEMQARDRTVATQHAEDIWSHTYARPQFARKHCPDLAVTGPCLRGPLMTTTKAPQARGVYAYEGSVTSTTTNAYRSVKS
jgi:hypothetical protein